MDALAAAAAVVTIHSEDYAEDEMELDKAAGTSADDDARAIFVEPSLAGKEDQGKLFKMFSSLKRSTQMNTNGVGLGLFICKNILN